MTYDDEGETPPDVITSDTENRTMIMPEDAPDDKEWKFRGFREYNRGTYNGPRREETEVLRRQDDLHRYDAIASSLLTTSHQKSRGRQLLDDFDLHKFGQSLDMAVFAICVVVANDDYRGGVRYYPGQVDDSEFIDMANSLGISVRKQLQVIEKVRKRVEL